MVSIFRPVLHIVPSLTVGEVEAELRGLLAADSVALKDADSERKIRSDASIASLANRRILLHAIFPNGFPAGDPDASDAGSSDVPAGPAAGSGNGGAARPPATPAGDPGVERVIGELARHESARGFVWIKYLVEALLPDLGFRGAEAQTTLDRMKDSQVIILAKVPNPKRPEFPVTEVRLNRSHPLVEQVLAQGKAPTARFPLGTVRGEPLSHTILRERR